MKTSRQCRGIRKDTRERCKRPALVGQTVCYRHGGNTQAALRAARMRMLAACEPAIMVLLKVVGDDRAADSDRIRAANSILDRGGMAPGIDISAVIQHRVPGWERVIQGMFAEPKGIEASAGPSAEESLAQLTEAYNLRGYVYQEARRRHAARVLGWDVQSSVQLSASDIQTLLDDLRPPYSDPGVIDGEVVSEDRGLTPERRARVSRARVSRARSEPNVRVESGDDRPPPGYLDRPRGFY